MAIYTRDLTDPALRLYRRLSFEPISDGPYRSSYTDTDLADIPSAEFDLVCSTNGFFVWIADLAALFGEVQRILKPGGFYVFYDIHPFQRPWGDMEGEPTVDKAYGDTGPFSDSEDGPFNFHWTMGDLLNALADAGLSLSRLRECPPKEGSSWDGTWYFQAGLPVWLIGAAQKIAIE